MPERAVTNGEILQELMDISGPFLDACRSWMRALHISYNFLRNVVYRNILILNAEFNYEYRGPIKSPDEFAYRFADRSCQRLCVSLSRTEESGCWC